MKKVAVLLAAYLAFSSIAYSETEKKTDQNQLFYTGNAYYEKGEYQKAVEQYLLILDKKIESGDLYYNIGNGFFKLGKVGYAILCYERARRIIPHDSDLRSNLSYAKSIAGQADIQIGRIDRIINAMERPFRDMRLSVISWFSLFMYLITIISLAIYIINPGLRRRLILTNIAFVIVFTYSFAAFIIRYHNECVISHGIVVSKEVEAKYEPIDKATTFYTLREGADVSIIKTKNGWRQVKRSDGKIAWVKKDSVETI